MSIARRTAVFLLSLVTSVAYAGREAQIHDADTLSWWHTTEALSGDGMEGRDTGSPAYQRAADYVARRFKAAGLKPAGEKGSYFQQVPMHEIAASEQGTDFTLIRQEGPQAKLKFLQEITYEPQSDMPAELEGALTFRGYCGQSEMQNVAGKVVVCFGNKRAQLPGEGARIANAVAGHAVAVVNVDDPHFNIEPPRWPVAYARTVRLRTGPTEAADPICVMRLSAAAFAEFVRGTEQDVDGLLRDGGAQKPLPSFDVPARLHARFRQTQRDISSPNVLAVLPGGGASGAAAPGAAAPGAGAGAEYVVVSAHLDGYGFGTPVNGDKLYNGTLDDSAYVALLIQMADNIRSHKLPAPGRGILFAAFTGEEKGLLGSKWFVGHPTIPLPRLVANVNLDQLRPLFPLDILTAEALDETTLGDIARSVASAMRIQLRPDAEPERNLLRRADQYPFLLHGVPAISFVFGFDPGTESEQRYREWYRVRYHRPQDDLTQPMDFAAAAKFNEFFYKLVAAIADVRQRPAMLPTSQFPH